MPELRVGIVGCGYIGKKRAEIAASHRLSQVDVVADIEPLRARALAKTINCRSTGDWQEVVDSPDIDILVVSTTNGQLAPIALEALKNKKHVLCEKPMAINSLEAIPLITAAKESQVILKAGLSLRHHSAINQAYSLYKSGAIGRPIFMRCRYGHGGRPGYDREWRAKKAISGGGELLDQGIHVTDLFRWFFGDFKEAVGFNINGFWDTEGMEDNAFALFRTADEKVASLHVSWTQWRNLFSFEVFGDGGHLKIEGLGGGYGTEKLVVSLGAATGSPPDEKIIEYSDHDLCWSREWDEFLSAISEKRQPIGSGADALAALAMVDAVYRSNEERRVIEIKNSSRFLVG